MEKEELNSKTQFEKPEVSVTRFAVRDIVRTSLNMPFDPFEEGEEDEDF